MELITGVYDFYVKQNHGLILNIQLVVGGFTLPIAGWLADIYFGCYKLSSFEYVDNVDFC